jgi:DNA-binding transcriptional MerR regulator
MNLNIFGRLKKKEPKELKEVPPERIEELSKTELSEAEIIDTLRKEGYSFESIDKAMNYAVKTGVEESPLPGQDPLPPQGSEGETQEQPAQQAQQYPQQEQQSLPGQEFPPAEYPQEPPLETQFLGEMPAQRTAASVEEVEEIVEAVTEEKLADINDQILKIEEKINSIGDVMQKLSNSLQDVVKNTKREKDEMNAKIEEFNTTLNETIPRITSLEKAFKSNIPSLIDEVKGFAETIENLKMKKKKKISG